MYTRRPLLIIMLSLQAGFAQPSSALSPPAKAVPDPDAWSGPVGVAQGIHKDRWLMPAIVRKPAPESPSSVLSVIAESPSTLDSNLQTTLEMDAATSSIKTISLKSTAPAQPQDAEPQGAPAAGASSLEVARDEPTFWARMFKDWKFNTQLGINGSQGNSEFFNFRGSLNATRSTDKSKSSLGASYSFATRTRATVENRLRIDGRQEWLQVPLPRLRSFANATLELDEFQSWDYRASGNGGLGYTFYDTPKIYLLGSMGLGVSQEIGGGSNQDLRPEAVLGAEFRYTINERQKITANFDAFPNLSDTERFRARGRAQWEILVDPETTMTLRLGLEDRFDTQAGKLNKNHDLDYFATLGWSF